MDAVRNRSLLLSAALRALTDDEAAPLDRIAREAGVGIGTLYRHFPTREALVEAVYRTELDALCDAAPGLLSGLSPEVALLEWMERYADFVATKRGMASALRGVIDAGVITSGQTREQLSVALRVFLEAGAASGTLRSDVRPADVTASLAGILMAARHPDPAEQRAQVSRMLDLLVDGLRPRP